MVAPFDSHHQCMKVSVAVSVCKHLVLSFIVNGSEVVAHYFFDLILLMTNIEHLTMYLLANNVSSFCEYFLVFCQFLLGGFSLYRLLCVFQYESFVNKGWQMFSLIL